MTRTVNNYFQTEEQIVDNTKFIKPKEITSIIRKLKNRKAPGPDGIQNTELKHLPRKAIVYLTYLYNACIQKGYFPAQWKIATILPIYKSGKSGEDPNNYRPISLLCSMAKILEKVMVKRILEFIEDKEVLHNEQFGFRHRHSTIHQLVRVSELISKNFNTKKSTAAVLLDIHKAFDTVWHVGLLYKLIKLKFPRYIIKFIRSYLEKRYFQVTVHHAVSELYEITAGVPQGSVLGTILYAIYLHDLPQTKETE